MLRIALPNKGRLAEGARSILDRAGLGLEARSERALQANLGEEFAALFVSARDIPEFVADGAADVGITGRDLVCEIGRPLEELLDLGFGGCHLALAVRDDGPVRSLDDLEAGARVATTFPRLSGEWFERQGKRVTLVPVSGATENAPHLGVADAIVDLVSTGSTLKVNGLREVATVLESSAVLIADGTTRSASDGRGRALEELVAALESVLRAQDRRYLMANVPKRKLEEVKRILPGLNGPTVVDVVDEGRFVAAHAVVRSREVYRVIAQLKSLGAEGILVTRIERLMP